MTSFGTWLAAEASSPARGAPVGFGPLAARVTAPSGRFNGLGVAVLPAIGYDNSSSFRALHVLAGELARQGCLVARVDPYATGDSAGIAGEVADLRAWKNAVEEGSAYLRRSGARQVVLVGCRFGATLAILGAEAVGAAAVVALAPVVSG
ncbi:MAG: hypothetical protein ACRDZX_05485, partial [Acidimicrobiales bacterium]